MEMHQDFGPRRSHQGPSAAAVVVLAIIFGIVAGFGGTILALMAIQQGYVKLPLMASGTSPAPVTRTTIVSQATGQKTFAQVAEQINPSVVNINTTSSQPNPYSFFFGGPQQNIVKGLGTGVILDAKGFILTNFHVVGDAQKIMVTVTTKDGNQEYPAELIGGDKQEDMALIKINAPNLQPVQFGDSDKLQPGDWVMAVGNPFGFEHTVSVGVVSALNRRLPVDGDTTLRGMIQTDASINPGNSGGPLVNEEGQVIGINTAIYVGGGNQPQANGIGFAIPSNRAQKVLQILREHKKVTHPYIGIKYAAIDDEVRRTERLPVREGVIVKDVYKSGPAGKAGITINDLLLTADGKPLRDANALADYINQQEVGKKIVFTAKHWDDGKSTWQDKQYTVKLEDMPKEFLSAMRDQEQQQQQPQDQQPQDNGGDGLPFPFGP